MTDWIKQAGDRARTRREKRQQYKHALETQLSGFWDAFGKVVAQCIDEFNNEKDMGAIFKVDTSNPKSIVITNRGEVEGVRLEISLDTETGSTYCAYENVPNVPKSQIFSVGMDTSGVLCFVFNGHGTKRREEVARMLLEPLFDTVY